jgi:hypothetical protein
MKVTFKFNLLELKNFLEANQPRHEFIPSIIDYISTMIELLDEKDNNLREVAGIAYGIERVISEDFGFCESEIGEKIFIVMNSIIDASKKEI